MPLAEAAGGYEHRDWARRGGRFRGVDAIAALRGLAEETMQMQTLFIVGAGREAELPVSRELATRIAETLKIQSLGTDLLGDREIIDVIEQFAPTRDDRDVWLKAARLIRQGVVLSNSIDSFIDTHNDDAKVQFLGKRSLVFLETSLTGFESQSVSGFSRRFPSLYLNMIGALSIFSITLYKSIMGLVRAMHTQSLIR